LLWFLFYDSVLGNNIESEKKKWTPLWELPQGDQVEPREKDKHVSKRLMVFRFNLERNRHGAENGVEVFSRNTDDIKYA